MQIGNHKVKQAQKVKWQTKLKAEDTSSQMEHPRGYRMIARNSSAGFGLKKVWVLKLLPLPKKKTHSLNSMATKAVAMT